MATELVVLPCYGDIKWQKNVEKNSFLQFVVNCGTFHDFHPHFNFYFIFLPIAALWNSWKWYVIQQIKKVWPYKYCGHIEGTKTMRFNYLIFFSCDIIENNNTTTWELLLPNWIWSEGFWSLGLYFSFTEFTFNDIIWNWSFNEVLKWQWILD